MRLASPSLLKTLRQAKRLTQTEMGQRIGVTKAAVSAYELGKTIPSGAVLAGLAHEFAMSSDELWRRLTTTSQSAPAATPEAMVRRGCRTIPLLEASQQPHFALSFTPGTVSQALSSQVEVCNVPLTADFVDALVVEMPDEAMSPTLRAGSYLLATPVASVEWPYIPSGVYCLVYRTTFIVRRIKDNDLVDKKRLLLYADSTAGGTHPVRSDDLRAIWRIRWIVYAPVS
jgi:repressor LexA